MDVAEPDELQSCLHRVDLNRVSTSIPKVINALLLKRESFSILYGHDFHCTRIDEIQGTLEDVSVHDFHVACPLVIKAIGHKKQRVFIEAYI